jgi:hypothetical protein
VKLAALAIAAPFAVGVEFALFAQAGVQLLRMDRDGDVTASSDRHAASLQAFVPTETSPGLARDNAKPDQ